MQTCRYRPGVSALMCSFCCLFFLKAVPFGFDHCHAFPGLELPPRAGSPPFAGFLPFADHALVGLPALHWLSCFRPFAGSLLFEGFPLQAFAPPWAPCPSRPSCPSQAHCPWRTSCTGALCGLSALRGVSTLFRAFAACSQILKFLSSGLLLVFKVSRLFRAFCSLFLILQLASLFRAARMIDSNYRSLFTCSETRQSL